jgi:hypothetical protein
MTRTDVDFSDDMPFEEKDKFWTLIYEKVSDAVKKKYDFTIIFQLEQKGLEDDEGYSIIIKKEDYEVFLKNFLLWCEDLERYELCSEAKKLLQKLQRWQTKNSN